MSNIEFDNGWKDFRKECAKSFVEAILSNPTWFKHFDGHSDDAKFDAAYYKKTVIGNALSYADCLIEQLKKEDDDKNNTEICSM